MKRVFLENIRVKAADDLIQAFYVDEPLNEAIIDEAEGLRIAGWVFCKTLSQRATVLITWPDGDTFEAPLNLLRPGAYQAVHKQAPALEEDARGGFSFRLPIRFDTFKLSFKVADSTYDAFNFNLITIFKVIAGKDGHLFLDNDTNRSVDQYTGKYLLDEPELAKWRNYFKNLDEIRKKNQSNVTFMVAPTKEEIYSEHHPRARGEVTPIDQIRALSETKDMILFPLEVLRAESAKTYSKIDTHWSDYGARVAARAYLEKVGLIQHEDQMLTKFKAGERYGDLGGKLEVKQLGVFLTADFGDNKPLIQFDNNIVNHGRVWVYGNEKAPVSETLILCGDSFAVNMSAMLSSVFKRVVYIYSAGGLEMSVINHEKPKYLLLQTNQRFLINAAPVDYNIWKVIGSKVKKEDADDYMRQINNIKAYGADIFYQDKIRDIFITA